MDNIYLYVRELCDLSHRISIMKHEIRCLRGKDLDDALKELNYMTTRITNLSYGQFMREEEENKRYGKN